MTRHRSIHTLLGTVFATAALVALVAPPASARIVEKESFHDEFSGTNDNFCGAGIAVDFEATVDGRYQVNSRGPGGPDYYLEKTTVVNVYTAAERDDGHRHPAQHHQQGPVARRRPGSGHPDDRGPADGRRAHVRQRREADRQNSGQVRFEIVYDYVNDVEISNELIFGSTGTNDDFCEAVLTDWGYL